MLAQICQFLGVDSSDFPLNEHVFVADKSKDGGFLIHYFLNLCVKQNRPLCFVGLSQSFNHYCTVAQKLGTNLLSARNNKNLIFIEGLRLISDIVVEGKEKTNPILQLFNGITSPLCNLVYDSLKEIGVSSFQEHFGAPVLIIDDLSVLLSVGVPLKYVVSFVKRLQYLVTSYTPQGSLIVSLCIGEGDGDEEDTWVHLSHLGTLSIEVSNLKSGYCKEVHGQIQVEWKDSYLKPRKVHYKHTQYRLSDKNIELFASGMSSAVL